jgi:Ca2+/Na+ antiporter
MNLFTFLAAYGGAILGSAVGIFGGVLGTWCSIHNTRTAAERAFMIRCSIAVWVLVTAFLAGLMLVPQPYNYLLWIPYPIILTAGILWMNRMQARLRGTNCG